MRHRGQGHASSRAKQGLSSTVGPASGALLIASKARAHGAKPQGARPSVSPSAGGACSTRFPQRPGTLGMPTKGCTGTWKSSCFVEIGKSGVPLSLQFGYSVHSPEADEASVDMSDPRARKKTITTGERTVGKTRRSNASDENHKFQAVPSPRPRSKGPGPPGSVRDRPVHSASRKGEPLDVARVSRRAAAAQGRSVAADQGPAAFRSQRA